jgi:exodeoxyribonuclease III
MRILTANVNGIRSAQRKGFFRWLPYQRADVICLQEIRAHEHQIPGPEYELNRYQRFLHPAEKKGYSGVAIYTRHEPEAVVEGLGWEPFDQEGRYLEVRYPGLSVVSLYLPSGSSGDARQQVKYEFMDHLLDHLRACQTSDREYIICGDWNIAHKAIDLKNWRGNQKNSGFLPEERAWMDQLFGPEGFVDAFRTVDPRPDQYTWWSNRGQARAKNVGWRIDYQVLTAGLAETPQRARIHTRDHFSDHAPLIIDYDLELPR